MASTWGYLLGCEGNGTDEVLQCLQHVTDKIAKHSSALLIPDTQNAGELRNQNGGELRNQNIGEPRNQNDPGNQ